MTVPNEIPSNNYVANGVVKKFSVTFDYETTDTLRIKLNGNEPSIDKYYIDDVDHSFNFYLPPNNGDIIYIYRETPLERDIDYDNSYNSFRPKTINTDFDRVWRAIQEYVSAIIVSGENLEKEISDRIKADEDMLDYIMNQDNSLKQDYISRDALLKKYIDNMIALVTGDPSFNGIDDSQITTWSGRTQEEKNKENPSPFDFGANGDGVTNDTQAFIDLEAQYQGQIIDLLSRTYKVDRDFTKNKYTNGTFRVINSNVGKGVITSSSSNYQKANGNGQKIGEVICPLINDTVGTASTIVQSMYYYKADNRLYTQRVLTETPTEETCIIEEFDYAKIGVSAPPLFTSKPLNFVGHQSIAVQRTPTRKFWATVSKTVKPLDKSRHVVRFELNTTGDALNIEYIKVFGDDFIGDTVPVLSISPNGVFLIVTCTHPTKGRFVRVFNTATLIESGDYSKDYLYEFGFQYFEGFNPQSICCDDNFIYILHGGTTGQEKVETYTLGGSFVDLDDKFTVGAYDASLITHQYYEPESLFIGDNGRLLCCLAAGKKGGVNARDSFTNIISDVCFTSTRMRITDGDRPLYYLDAQRTYVHPARRQLSYWTVASTGIYSAYKTQNKNATVYSTIDNEGFQHRLNCNGTGQPQYRLTNALGDGMLQVSSGGGFGLYDIKTSKWVIVSTNGKSQVQQTLQLASVQVFADNVAAKTGGLGVGDVYRTATGQLMIVF